MKKYTAAGGLALLALVFAGSALYIVDETQYAVVVQLGRPVRVVDSPGLHLKLPSPLQTVTYLDKRLLVFDPPGAEFLTEDKKNIVADAYLCWRIDNPLRFMQTVYDRSGAENRLVDLLFSELGVSFGTHPLSSLLSIDPKEVKIGEMMEGLRERCDETARREYGIAVVDAQLKRINFPEQNKQSVFDRMVAERERMAKKYRAEGQEEAMKIAAATEKEEKAILSEAYRKAQALRGEGEAEAARIYSRAYGKAPDFYRLVRTLEAYKKFMDAKTTVVLPTDSELLRLLTDGEGAKGGR